MLELSFKRTPGPAMSSSSMKIAPAASSARCHLCTVPCFGSLPLISNSHEINAILVTELSRWGRSTQDLVQTLDDLHSWKVSVLALNGLSFDRQADAHHHGGHRGV